MQKYDYTGQRSANIRNDAATAGVSAVQLVANSDNTQIDYISFTCTTGTVYIGLSTVTALIFMLKIEAGETKNINFKSLGTKFDLSKLYHLGAGADQKFNFWYNVATV